MARPRKAAVDGEAMAIKIVKDGVFIADDVRRDTGAEETVPADVAKKLIESGHAVAL